MKRLIFALVLLLVCVPAGAAGQDAIEGNRTFCDECLDIEIGGDTYHFFFVHQFPPPYGNYDAQYAHSDTTAGSCGVWHESCTVPLDQIAMNALEVARISGLTMTSAEFLVANYPSTIRYGGDRTKLYTLACDGHVADAFDVRRSPLDGNEHPSRSRSAFDLLAW